MRYTFLLNGAPTDVEVDPDTPLLWVLRDHLNLTGTKFGCGPCEPIRRAIHRAAGEGA